MRRSLNDDCELWRVTAPNFTAGCLVDRSTGLILVAAPILRKFRGQPLHNLRRWTRDIGARIEQVQPV
jgi:hypothetical protein